MAMKSYDILRTKTRVQFKSYMITSLFRTQRYEYTCELGPHWFASQEPHHHDGQKNLLQNKLINQGFIYSFRGLIHGHHHREQTDVVFEL